MRRGQFSSNSNSCIEKEPKNRSNYKVIYIYIYIYILYIFMCVCVCVYTHKLGICISITEADAIRISMHSQRYDTLKIHMKQLVMMSYMIAFIYLVQTDSKS